MIKTIIIFIIFLFLIGFFWFFVADKFISNDRKRENMWDDYNKRFK